MGYAMVSGGKPDMAAPVSEIKASDLAVGSVVKLMEDGVATEYLVVNQGIPSGSSLYDDSCDGTWLLRKDIKENRMMDADNSNVLETSDIHIWLNGEFFNIFGSIEQAAIKQVKIPYRSGGGDGGLDKNGTNGLSCKVFLLSGYEVGFTTSIDNNFPVDGAKLDYFELGTDTSANNKRIAYLNGSTEEWWLRSPLAGNSTRFWEVGRNGIHSFNGSTGLDGIRQAVIIPSNALFDKKTLILKGVA